MRIGTVFDQTSTTEFYLMLDTQLSDEQLLFSYVELPVNGVGNNQPPQANEERIIARITNVLKENPLLSRDQAGVSASLDIASLGFDFSRRFTYGWAQCTVLGTLTPRGLDMNRRGISPNMSVFTPSEDTLRRLFFSPEPSHIPVGEIETLGDGREMSRVPITMNADQMVTKHFCIFGMTGSGKTNTSAKIVEELMARGQKMVIFDSHDDYINLENLANLFVDFDEVGNRLSLNCNSNEFEAAVNALVQHIETNFGEDHELRADDFDLVSWVSQRLLQTASIVHKNRPTREIVRDGCGTVTVDLLNSLSQQSAWWQLISSKRIRNHRSFPEIRYYGDGFQDFTIQLMSAIGGEEFTAAQWRALRGIIDQAGHGITYLQNLYRAIGRANMADSTRDVLQQRCNALQAMYREATSSGLQALDLETFFQDVATRDNGQTYNVYRLSLTDLSSNMRKALVYAIVTYFFRKFKFGGYRARNTRAGEPNAYSTLFLLEEARSLIPKSTGFQDNDTAGSLARRAMRELAYEGRKFSLGFGLISQKPASVDAEVVSQANTFILHQLKSPDDQQYVRTVTESMSSEELDMIKGLGTGRALIAGIAVKSPVLVRMHFRYSEEGIPEPTPISDELSTVRNIRSDLGIEE